MSAHRRNDIAIYAPFAFAFYEAPSTRPAGPPRGGGGAELQTFLIAQSLARDGFRVAHIVFPVARPVGTGEGRLQVVQRPFYGERRRVPRGLAEVRNIWRAMAEADARVYVFRGGGRQLGLAAVFCLLRRRRLVFSASNDLDFIPSRRVRSRLGRAIYRLALRRCRRIVVQTRQQRELARRILGGDEPVSVIPSFAEPAEPADSGDTPQAFLWAGRAVDYKLPLRYLELARSLPEARFRMVATRSGETTPALEAQIAEEAASLPNVELLPKQDREDLLMLISDAAAVVLTSRFEGMPNVFLEAWARGVPVLSLHFDPDGVIAEQGVGLFAGGSWDRFVSEARRLWGEEALRHEIGERVRRYVAETHSPSVVGERWAAVLREVLSETDPAPVL